MKKQFSNKEIYSIATLLNQIFLKSEDNLYLPIKVNFLLQKNIKLFTDLGEEIDSLRIKIGQKYGSYDSNTQSYKIKSENMDQAQKELIDLMEIEQIVDVFMISFADLGDTKLTTQQMQALLFMIED